MIQELVEGYLQERRKSEACEQAYEGALEGLHRLSSFLFRDDRVVRNPGAIVREELGVSVVDGGEEFKVTLFLLGRGMGVMAIAIEDSQGEIAPVFYLSRLLKTFAGGERKFSQHLEVCGISEGDLKKEEVWWLDDFNHPHCGLRSPMLQEIQGYTRVLEQMKEALGGQ